MEWKRRGREGAGEMNTPHRTTDGLLKGWRWRKAWNVKGKGDPLLRKSHWGSLFMWQAAWMMTYCTNMRKCYALRCCLNLTALCKCLWWTTTVGQHLQPLGVKDSQINNYLFSVLCVIDPAILFAWARIPYSCYDSTTTYCLVFILYFSRLLLM